MVTTVLDCELVKAILTTNILKTENKKLHHFHPSSTGD